MILSVNMKNNFWLLVGGYWLVLLGLTIYSYSQIDLNLTLSSNFFYQNLQKQLIYLGYFNRHFSAVIYAILYSLLFTLYYLLFVLLKKGKINKQQTWFLILSSTGILLFSYPAFSHDIFNYIFDARILVHYQVNPWNLTALDFPHDLWTRFMHWTHRTYPYGPFWLVVSIIPYILGLGKFVLTLFNFKLLLALSYLGSCYVISKIASLPALVFFAFNPLVINESLISPHLDSFMTFLGLLAIWLYLGEKKVLGLISLAASVLVKYATFGYLPLFFLKIKKKWLGAFIFTLLAIIAQILMREILPWYFIPIFPLGIMLNNKNITRLLIGLSAGGVLYYLPYLYFGDYIGLVKIWRYYLFFTPLIISLTVNLLNFLKRGE